jgi:hypothetical protein
MRRAVATFHDLFVMTGEYSTPEFRARFAAQARDAAQRADAVIAVSEFTRSQVVSLLGVDPAKVHVVHHGVRAIRPAGAGPRREKVILNVGAIQKRKNIARLVEAFETLAPGNWCWPDPTATARRRSWRASNAAPRATAYSVPGYVSPDGAARMVRAGRGFRLPLARRRLRHAGAGSHGGGRPGGHLQPLRPARSGGRRRRAGGPRRHRGPRQALRELSS